MAFRQSYVGALKIVDPPRFAREVQSAIRKTDGDVETAAEILDVSPRTLFRWLAELRAAEKTS